MNRFKAKRIRAAHAVGREGPPEEIAAVAATPLTDEANLSGTVASEDGGQTARIPPFKAARKSPGMTRRRCALTMASTPIQ